MLLTQQTFYRKYGVRVLPQVSAPMMHDLSLLEFPRESIYHYLTFDQLTPGPQDDDPLLRHVKKAVPVHCPLQLTCFDGHPNRLGGDGTALVRDYLQSHRRMRRVTNFSQSLKDKETPVIVNYALLNKLYRYQASVFSTYYHWRNLFVTFLHEFNMLAQITNHHQYVFIHAPKTLPSVLQLNAAAEEFTQASSRIFREPSSYLLLELWKWFDANEDTKSVLDEIPKEKIHLLNFVFVEAGKWCLINAGILRSFYLPKDAKEPDPAYVVQARQHVSGLQMAKRVLRMYMSVMEARSAALKSLLEQEKAQQEQTSPVITEQEVQTLDDVAPTGAAPQEAAPLTQGPKLTTQVNSFLSHVSVIDEQELDEMPPDEFKRLIGEQDVEINQDLAQLEEISAKALQETSHASMEEIISQPANAEPEDGVMAVCERLAVTGSISAGEYRKHSRLATSYKELKAPIGEGTLADFLPIPAESLAIHGPGVAMKADTSTVLDKTMLHSTLNVFDRKYVKHVLHKDIANTVMAVQNAGIAVTKYNVEKIEDILGGYEKHTVRLSPVVGQQSTLSIKLPVIREDGTYVTNGVKYRLRKQRGDVPIRKTAPNVVALTSYYGKCFVTRGKRNSDSYGYWLQNRALAEALDPANQHLTDSLCDNVFDNELLAPRNYSSIANTLAQVTVGGRFRVRFDCTQAMKDDGITAAPKDGSIYLGKDLAGQSVLWLSKEGRVKQAVEGHLDDLGTLEEFMGIDASPSPVEFITVRVFGKDLPIAVILGLQMGMEKLLGALRLQRKEEDPEDAEVKQLAVNEYRVVPAGSRVKLQSYEYTLGFSNETWVFHRDNTVAAMIMGSLNEYQRSLKLFSASSFDQRGAYVNLLETNGISVRYVRELDLMSTMFIDSITRDILIEMGEPTTYQGLLFRACQMLLNDQHPEELDPACMRIKGYERISGAIYTELVHSLRQHNSALGRANLGVQMNPYSVWKRISEDPAKLQVSEINPLATLKDEEAVTYLGEGGRGRLSMTKRTRGYHPNDMGTISEATVDNSDVSINVHTSADPMFSSLRGMSKRFDMSKPNPTAMLSTSALLSPASDRDDPKRVNFVSIQQKHAIACVGYHQPIVRTGYETVLAHRTSDLYAYTAKKPGTVRSISEKGVIVDYEDGTVEGYEIGRRFGNAQGLTVAHEVVTPLKEGDKVGEGDCIVYNTGFFEPDFFEPRHVVWKNSLNVRTVLWESTQTHEDSSSLSKRISESLSTRVTKVKIVVIAFNQAISSILKEGDAVTAESVLCTIEDEVTANNKLFNEQSIETLKALSAQTPRARVKGVLEKIEVFYHGDKEDMSESVRALCDEGDTKLRKRAQELGQKAHTGQVDGGFRIESNALALDSIAIRFYITSSVGAGVGDKGVFANQLKTCFGEVLEQPMVSEDGKEIDAIFGYRSLEARIVESPMIMGTTATLLRLVAQNAAAIYRGTAK